MTDGGAVVVNGRFLTQRVTGVQRFAREILAASAGAGLLRPETSWIAVPDQSDLPAEFAGLPLRRVGARRGHPWEQLDLSRQIGDSLLVNLCGTGPALRRRQLVVMHDAAVSALPRNYTLAFRSWYRLLARAFARFAERICTVSAFSASELQKYFGIPAGRIEVIPESGEHIMRAEPDYGVHERFGLGDGDYFLAVSSHASNKNFRRVVEAATKVSRSGFKFVIVGGRNAKVFQAVDMDVSLAVEVGYVSDAQLQALYRRAACFVYPSTYEGFGLPPLEAMACGCPVLVSRCAALPETCGDAAAYCDAFDSDDIARQLSRILGSAQARDELSAAGLARSGEWTWRRAGDRFSEILAGT